MKSKILNLVLFLVFIAPNIEAQNIKKLIESGKDSIINYSLNILKQKKIKIPYKKSNEIRVMANSTQIYVLFNMGFMWNENEKQLANYDLKVLITKDNYSISPFDYHPDSSNYKLNKNQKNTIEIVLDKQICPFAVDERMQIKEEKDFFELIISRGISRGAECYHINKKTGEKQMVWHETPNPNYKDFIDKEEEEFNEII
ncbi:MAG: hypothetical protein HXX09_05050 [Bacteroidetes bacterium]|nr:hypothetical protein [Bacteroidota bacterium]